MSKGTKAEETIDLLVELLETYKPHLKPYSERLKSWVDMLQEYNEIAGTHYKQPRTLKRRFERIVDMYRSDKSLPSCQNPILLSRLIDEYNKPYRLVHKTDFGSVESNDMNSEPLQDVTNDNVITRVPKVVHYSDSTLLQPIQEEENESMRAKSNNNNNNNNSKNTTTEIIQKSQSQKRPLREHSTQKKKTKKDIDIDKLNYIATDSVPHFDVHDILQSDGPSNESSTQPLPLDTITVGEQLLRRQNSVCSDNEVETDEQDLEDYRSYSSDPSVSTTKKVKQNGTYLMRRQNNYYRNDTVSADLPKSIFILDKNDKLVELKTTDNGPNTSIEELTGVVSNVLHSGRGIREHIVPDELTLNKKERRHYNTCNNNNNNNNLRGAKSSSSSTSNRRDKLLEISNAYNVVKTNINKPSSIESQILSELNQIRLEHSSASTAASVPTTDSSNGRTKIETNNSSRGSGSYMQVVTSAFNEATTDTPTFRASVNYYDTKVNDLQEWLGNTLDYIEYKYIEPKKALQRAEKLLLKRILPNPTLLSNGLVSSQSQAPTVAEEFNKNYSEFVQNLENIVLLEEQSYSDILLGLQIGAIEPYVSKRKHFEECQTKYDNLVIQTLAKPWSTSHTKPSYLKDEEEKLFLLRKDYLEASFELVWAIITLRLAMDKFMVELMGGFNKKNVFTFKEDGKQINLSPIINHRFHSYFEWVKNSMTSFKSLHENLEQGKNHVYRKIIREITPSTDQKDYILSSIETIKSNVDPLTYLNKPVRMNGWLLMKTSVGPSDHTVWVKRWCSVDEYMFGMFLLSANRCYVEETDKFGISLINLKYPIESSRRFCFNLEITRRNTNAAPMIITLQAKNVSQLKEWILAFTRSKMKLEVNLKDKSKKYEISCGLKRYSPRFMEFASSSTTYYDQLLTTKDNGTVSLIESLKGILKPDQITDSIEQKSQANKAVSSPSPTQLTPLALLAGPFRERTYRMLDAIQANIWGLNPINQNGAISANDDDPLVDLSRTKPKKLVFPKNYTDELKLEYIQYMTLCESINYNYSKKYLIEVDEFILAKFGHFWSIGSGQMFMCITYLTKKYMYNYLSDGGLFHLSRLRLNKFESAEFSERRKNIVVLRQKKGGTIKINVSLCNYRPIASKMQYLIELGASSTDKSVDDILIKFNDIDRVYREIAEKEELINDSGTNELIKTEYNLGKTFWNMDPSEKEIKDKIFSIQNDFERTYVRTYDVPAKALLHVMFGDQSNVFPNSLFLADKDSNYNKSKYWKTIKDVDGKIELERVIQFKQNRSNNFVADKEGLISLNQSITEMVENRYYEIEQQPIVLDISFCRPLKLTILYNITESATPQNRAASKLSLSSKGCRLYVHYKVEYLNPGSICFMERYVRNLIYRATDMEFSFLKRSIHYYLEKIGSHGQVTKAVKLGGLLGITMDKNVAKENDSSVADTKLPEITNVGIINDKTDEVTDDTTNGMIGIKDLEEENIEKEKVKPSKYNDLPVITYDLKLLIRITFTVIIYRTINAVFILLRFILLGITFCVKCVKCVNYMLLAGFIASIILNVVLSSRSAISYWSVRKANQIFDEALKGNGNNSTTKSISLQDLEILTNYLGSANSNVIFTKYKEQSDLKQNKYRKTRSEIGTRRNDLLIELRMLQDIEKELVRGDYRSFLLDEIEKCKQVTVEYPLIWEDDEQLQNYCNICYEEYKNWDINIIEV
ncbi:SNF1-interacting protein [Maudiozyma exigua]|uniref:SNF1-interacting protein n=1 Tax=Maudiozyma exigua TaxID=34358 RepID=A0A9P6WFK0_MAUEX|nr:SNF1-interacting protein [Kazachstania exigua]